MADQLVDVDTVSVRTDLGSTLEECIRSLAARLAGTGRLADPEVYVDDVLAREAQGATALPGGVALPHARSTAVLVPTVAVASLPTEVTAPNGEPFDLVFLLGVPADAADQYLQLLRKVTTAVVRPGFSARTAAAPRPPSAWPRSRRAPSPAADPRPHSDSSARRSSSTRRPAAWISARWEKACGKLPRCRARSTSNSSA